MQLDPSIMNDWINQYGDELQTMMEKYVSENTSSLAKLLKTQFTQSQRNGAIPPKFLCATLFMIGQRHILIGGNLMDVMKLVLDEGEELHRKGILCTNQIDMKRAEEFNDYIMKRLKTTKI